MVAASSGAASSERETVDGVRTSFALTRTRPLGGREPRMEPDDPRQIDRYALTRRLGVGGMSVVYEALDERIGRRVALKLMLVGDGGSDRERLRREAQALARVSHPNVVEVFEIGEHDGKPYVAMALVDGEPLDRWLRLRPRTPTEIIEAFLQAGEGLVAAHALGLVHRDFKPGNVLMGTDGRVRVVDFGLVRESGAVEPSSSAPLPIPAEISGGSLPSSAWTESLTRTGAMVGTPAYMSPEQIAGLAAGPASDQFSFCVALYEALYRRHPFVVGGNWAQLPYNVLEGRVQRPPAKSRVPKVIGALVMRGLGLRPEARWPAMDALLVALRRALDRRGPRPAAVAVGAGLLVLGAGVFGRSMQSPQAQHCQRGAVLMQRAWNADAREELRSAWIGTALPGAADTWSRVDARLQARVDDWWNIHHAACSGAAPASSSATCLLRWAEGLRTPLEVLAQPNESLVHNAVQMVGELPPLARCSDALDAPADASAPEVPPWQAELDRVDALLSSSQLEQATRLVEALVARVHREPNPWLAAEANLRLGKLLMQRAEIDAAATAFEEAYLGAKLQGLDRLAAKSALGLLQLFGEVRHRPDEAARWAGHARAETERVGDPVLISVYLNSWGRALRSDQRLEEALVQHQQALALQHSLPALDASELALSHFQIGSVLGLLDRIDEGRPHLEEALRILEVEIGPRHPRVASTLTNIGIFLSFDGRNEEALEKLHKAREIALEAYPGNPWPAAFPLRKSAGIHASEGRPRRAVEDLRLYRDVYVQMHDPTDAKPALVELVTCEIAMYEGDYDRALGHCRRALGSEGVGTVEVELAGIYQTMATIFAKQGKLEEALATERIAHQVARQEAATHDTMQDVRRRWLEIGANHGLGRALARVGRYDEALAQLELANAAYADGFSSASSWRKQGVELDIGTTLLALGRAEEARRVLRSVIAAAEARTGAQGLELQRGLVALAKAELEAGDAEAARAVAERALALLEARDEAVLDAEAAARFVLARCIVASDRARALALARRAEDDWASLGLGARRELEEVHAWIVEHGGRVARRPA
jgi:eukaryotic-like serine/threonine-protein kinase